MDTSTKKVDDTVGLGIELSKSTIVEEAKQNNEGHKTPVIHAKQAEEFKELGNKAFKG